MAHQFFPFGGQLMPIVREILYVPDGKCPRKTQGGDWNERRECSVLRVLCEKYGYTETRDALYGLQLLRDAGQLRFAKPGTKMTTRALYVSQQESHQLFHLARITYRRSLNARAHAVPNLRSLLYGAPA